MPVLLVVAVVLHDVQPLTRKEDELATNATATKTTSMTAQEETEHWQKFVRQSRNSAFASLPLHFIIVEHLARRKSCICLM